MILSMNNKTYPYRLEKTEEGDSVMMVSFASNDYASVLEVAKKKAQWNAVMEVSGEGCWVVEWEEVWGCGEWERVLEADRWAKDQEDREAYERKAGW